MITKFEQLSNELILIVFDYLDFYQFYEIFSCLNERFMKLILHQAKISIDFNSIPDGKFLKFCFHLHQCLTISQNYPLSIHAENQHKFTLLLKEDFFTEKFSQLKSLSIAYIDISTLSKAIFNENTKLYKSLERLHLLQNITGEYFERDQFCVDLISSKMESLKYLNLNFKPYSCGCDYYPDTSDYDVDLSFETLRKREKSFSHLETIVIGDIPDHNGHTSCRLTEIKISFYTLVEKLFPYVPKLKNLFLNSIHFDEDNCQRQSRTLSITRANSIIPFNLKLIQIWTDRYKYQQDEKRKTREFLQNFFLNSNASETTNIKIFRIDNQNVLERKL